MSTYSSIGSRLGYFIKPLRADKFELRLSRLLSGLSYFINKRY